MKEFWVFLLMNDFTKEELIIIHLDICTYLNMYPMLKSPQHHIDLRDKVKSMISNYCEHEKVVPNYDCKTECNECGVILR